MEQHAVKIVMLFEYQHLFTITLETSDDQSSNLYLKVHLQVSPMQVYNTNSIFLNTTMN
jgi:hypothetical protein